MPDTSPPGRGWRGNGRDQICGLLFILVGAAIAWKAQSYSVGPPSNSGPGFFPFYLGLILVGLGVVIAVMALLDRSGASERLTMHPRTFFGVLLPVILFGVLLVPAGLVVSSFVAVLLSSIASREFRWRGSLINACVLAAIVLGGFHYILRIQIPVWPNALIEWMR